VEFNGQFTAAKARISATLLVRPRVQPEKSDDSELTHRELTA
jgi:hypothetical protein